MGSEKQLATQLSKTLKSVCNKHSLSYHYQRIENRVGVGAPDISLCISGVDMWIELKHFDKWPRTRKLDIGVKNRKSWNHEKVWMKKRAKAGGICIILIQIGKGYIMSIVDEDIEIPDIIMRSGKGSWVWCSNLRVFWELVISKISNEGETVETIVQDWLDRHDYDGLYCDWGTEDDICGCLSGKNLMNCTQECIGKCQPAYAYVANNEKERMTHTNPFNIFMSPDPGLKTHKMVGEEKVIIK